MMDTISLKMEESLLQEIDQKLKKHRYSTRTEFIRDAVREKLSELEKDELLRKVSTMKKSSNKKTTDKELHEAREKAFKTINSHIRS